MAAKSGVITVAASGTAVQGPDTGPGVFTVEGDPENTKFVFFGNDGAGDVAAANGFKLGPGDKVMVETESLDTWWFDVSVNGEKAIWVKSAATRVNPSGMTPMN